MMNLIFFLGYLNGTNEKQFLNGSTDESKRGTIFDMESPTSEAIVMSPSSAFIVLFCGECPKTKGFNQSRRGS